MAGNVWTRDFLLNAGKQYGIKDEDIGWDAPNQTVTLKGQPFYKATGTDTATGRSFGDPVAMQSALSDWAQQNTPGMGYTSPYSEPIKNLMDKIVNRPAFTYDPSDDPMYQQASEKIQKNVMNDFRRRNMIFSPGTGKAVSEGLIDAVPQFMQQARQQYDTEGQDMYNQLNALMSLDTQGYNMYKDTLDNSYRERVFASQENQRQIDEQRQKIKDAWEKVDNTGYVDNETSTVLGLPVGTKSKAARESAEKQLNQLAIMEKENEYKIADDNRSFTNQKALIKYKDDLDQQQKDRDAAAGKRVYDLIGQLTNKDNPTFKGDISKVYDYVTKNPSQVMTYLKTPDEYDKVLSHIESLYKVQTDQNKTLDQESQKTKDDLKKTVRTELDDMSGDNGWFGLGKEDKERKMIEKIFDNASLFTNEEKEMLLNRYGLPTGQEAIKIYQETKKQ